jgi:transaldolase
MIDTDTIAQVVNEIIRKGFTHEFGKPTIEIKTLAIWEKVRNTGTRLWLDTGDIEEAGKLWCSQFEALTTNNTLLNKEVQKGIYDELITEAASAIKEAAPEIDEKQLLLEVSFVLNAYHGLRLVELFDAHVSVELHTDLGNDVDRSVEYGKRYYEICPERFYIKVPLTPAGLLVVRKLGKLGIGVNFTLGFSTRHNYAATLISQPAFVNVFLGRLNAFVADNNLGDGLNVGERATIATQTELHKLREDKRTSTLLIAASLRNGPQVASLAGVDVHTMPPKAAVEYLENPAETITGQLQEDLKINLASGITFDDFNASTLWWVSDTFKACVDELLTKDVDQMKPGDIQAHFADAGFADFLPKWSREDIQIVSADGKIPVYAKWKDRLANGEIGLDALMNISAFYSFATDQESLDNRIKSLL